MTLSAQTDAQEDRVSFLEFVTGGKVKGRRSNPPQPGVSYAGRLFDRSDVETALFSGSLSGLVCISQLAKGAGPESVFFATGTTLLLVPTVVYGLRVLGHVAPEAAASVTQFALTVRDIRPRTGSPVSSRAVSARQVMQPINHEEKWRQELRRFLLAAKLAGSFSIRELAQDKTDERGEIIRAKYVSESGWKVYNSLFRGWGILATRRVNGRAQTWWAEGWDYARAVFYLKHEALIGLPQDDPPQIDI